METGKQTQPCPYCGEEIIVGAKKCRFCNEWLEKPPTGYFVSNGDSSSRVSEPVHFRGVYDEGAQWQSEADISDSPNNNRVTVNVEGSSSNGVGTAGFVIALIAAFFSWMPGVNGIMWFLGLLLSFFGIFKKPRGLAIVGFIISIIDIIIIISVFGTVFGFLSDIFE